MMLYCDGPLPLFAYGPWAYLSKLTSSRSKFAQSFLYLVKYGDIVCARDVPSADENSS